MAFVNEITICVEVVECLVSTMADCHDANSDSMFTDVDIPILTMIAVPGRCMLGVSIRTDSTVFEAIEATSNGWYSDAVDAPDGMWTISLDSDVVNAAEACVCVVHTNIGEGSYCPADLADGEIHSHM